MKQGAFTKGLATGRVWSVSEQVPMIRIVLEGQIDGGDE